MKILLISSSYPRDKADWRSQFLGDLMEALSKKPGMELSLWAPPGFLPPQVMNAATDKESLWLRKLMEQGGIAHTLRTKGILGARTILELLFNLRKAYRRNLHADLYHVAWLQNALPLWGISKPLVISVLGSDYALLKFPGMVSMLRSIMKQRRCVLCPNAEWMIHGLERHFGDVAEIRCIPFGVNAELLGTRRNPSEAPRKWITVARLTEKKLGDLFSWGEGLFGGQDELHLLGPMQENIAIPPWVHYHGPTNPGELQSEWFPQASGLISLSRHDEGRPQIMLEAMAARVPVIASDMPAHRDVIENGRTGWIATSKKDFEEGLKWLSDRKENEKAGASATHWILDRIGTWNDCAEKYSAVYEKLVRTER